ncbi:MAG TPA: crosslink repair DNA glycosylase YcaQ family protein, partial [Candidatus Limnocylindria bacterium]
VLTREELIAAIVVRRGLGHVGDALRSGWGTLLKPLAWQGDLAFGPSQGNRVTFTLPDSASARWAGLPEPEAAAPTAIAAYLGAYGPATFEQFGHWLAGGWLGKKQLRVWFHELGPRLAEVDVDGDRRYILAKDLDELASTRPTRTVRLLPGFDQYVMGPGTRDGHVTPVKRRSAVSKQAGWISPVVLSGGVVRGTWDIDGHAARVTWFSEGGPVPQPALRAEVKRLATILDRDLELQVTR